MSDFQEVENIFKDWLLEAKKDLKKRGPYWNPTLITGECQARTVVLRGIEDDTERSCPRFIIHTDIRSQKWIELKEKRFATLHFYCPKRKWQMRVSCSGVLHHKNDDARIEWNRLSPNSKEIYSLKNIPGTKVVSAKEAYTFEEKLDPMENFGVITLIPNSFESLQLSHPMRESFHVRAKWLVQSDKKPHEFSYLAP